jgi:hypothetical protein
MNMNASKEIGAIQHPIIKNDSTPSDVCVWAKRMFKRAAKNSEKPDQLYGWSAEQQYPFLFAVN